MSKPRPSRSAVRYLGVAATAAVVLGASGSAFAATPTPTDAPAPIAIDGDDVEVSVQSRVMAEYWAELLESGELAGGIEAGGPEIGAALEAEGLAGAVAAAADDDLPLISLGEDGGTFTATFPAQVDPAGAVAPDAVTLDYIVPDSTDPELADVITLVDGQGLDVVVTGQDVVVTIDADQTNWPAAVESDEFFVPENVTGVYGELTVDGLEAVDAPDAVSFEGSVYYALDVLASPVDAADGSVLSVAGLLTASPETAVTGSELGFVLPTGGVLEWTGLTDLELGSATLFDEDFDIEELGWTVGADTRTATASLAGVDPGDYTLVASAFDADTLNDVSMFADIEIVAAAPAPTPTSTVVVQVPVPVASSAVNPGLSVDTGWEDEAAGNGLLFAFAGAAALVAGGGLLARRRLVSAARHDA